MEHTPHPHTTKEASGGLVALVGHPNVGKSTIFEALTGHRVLAANYPGTTVEVVRAEALSGVGLLVDSPGLLSLPSRTEDEQATIHVLLEDRLRSLVQVGDAKNLRRTLILTVQLAETKLPLTLALNMDDEASERGVAFDDSALAQALGIGVVRTTAVRKAGLRDLEEAMAGARQASLGIEYPEPIEQGVAQTAELLPKSAISTRSLALLFLAGDPVVEAWVRDRVSAANGNDLVRIRTTVTEELGLPISSALQRSRFALVDSLVDRVELSTGVASSGWQDKLNQSTTHPLLGLPVLLAVLFAMHWFVGILGAGILVDWLENRLFGDMINPAVIGFVERLISFEWISDFLVGEYGLWTMGMTYALALILPIVTTFFLFFGVLEDSGYLPRLAVLTNRVFRSMGLNGKAVVPMVLGLGCVTMATMTTRILETRRERMLVILLLSLGVPCSAQLGVVMGMLGGISLAATLIWGVVIVGVLLVVGWLAARLLPGERSLFLTELPPLRRPPLHSVIIKTAARVEWYLKEVVPLFLLGSAILFVLDRTNALVWLTEMAEPMVVGWLRLPAEAAGAFLMGFFRRDFGATGLFLIADDGGMTALQTVVAMTTITLFIPCVASVLMIARERGAKTASAVTLVVFPLAILIGGVLGRVLEAIGWGTV